jgi:RNA polymerase sigma-70 factor (ECF subfamily)
MDDLAQRFEENRPHLRAVAYRMLGSRSEAEDAVQEAWLRLSGASSASPSPSSAGDGGEIANLRGWLTTVVARVCLDALRTRKRRREQALDDAPAEKLERSGGFEYETEVADGIGVALLVVLEMLSPAERVSFVLHDLFDLSFDEIAPIVGRSSAATRQLASRARRRVQGAGPDASPGGKRVEALAVRTRQREIVTAFLTASRGGDFTALMTLLDPDVVLHADPAAVKAAAAAAAHGAPQYAETVHGAAAVAEIFKGRAQAARVATIDGAFGAVYAPGGTPRVAFEFTVADGRIVGISISADPDSVREMEIGILDA